MSREFLISQIPSLKIISSLSPLQNLLFSLSPMTSLPQSHSSIEKEEEEVKKKIVFRLSILLSNNPAASNLQSVKREGKKTRFFFVYMYFSSFFPFSL